MPGVDLTSLQTVPDAVTRSAGVIEALDRCLVAGFGRLGGEQGDALAPLGRAFAGTPLGEQLGQAIQAIQGNDFQERHFTLLAAARAALQAARYDALLAQAREALGRPVPPTSDPSSSSGSAPDQAAFTLCGSVRHWLTELAIAGFKNLDAAALAPFDSTLETLQSSPALGRLAALLTGFQRELLAALPMGTSLPAYRWGDLWARGMVLSAQCQQGSAAAQAGEKVSGSLTVLGVDARQHGAFVSDVAYALLDGAGAAPPRVVRITVSSYKVDALQGGECWRCYAGDPALKPLVRAIAENVPLKVKDATLLPTGDLLWDGTAAEAGKAVDVFSVAAAALAPGASTVFPTIAAEDRHPVQLAELIYLDALAGAPAPLPLAPARFAPGRGLTESDAAGAESMIVLLRFDADRWAIQPLVVRGGGKKLFTAFVGSNAMEAMTKKPKKGEPDTLAILRERAGRLLRKKS